MRRWTLLVCVTWLFGCNQILDIEERTSTADPSTTQDGGGGVTQRSSSTCDQYCADALQLCKADQGSQIFESTEACLGVCEKYSTEDKLDANTLSCRAKRLEDAKVGEAALYCQGAAPGGGSPGVDESSHCGTNCEGYCALRAAVCGAEADCLKKCQALPDTGNYNAQSDFRSSSDSIQCRLAHLSVAAAKLKGGDLAGRDAHCGHSGLRPVAPCELAADKNPKCADYCKLVTNTCTNDLRVYNDQAECMKACDTLQAVNPSAEKRANSIRCRREFTYDAFQFSPERFCTDSGPAPSQCGDRCESYCQLAQAACDGRFKMAFPQGMEQCKSSCKLIPANATYSLAKATRDTLDCRVKNATLALIDVRACESAISLENTGSGECKN